VQSRGRAHACGYKGTSLIRNCRFRGYPPQLQGYLAHKKQQVSGVPHMQSRGRAHARAHVLAVLLLHRHFLRPRRMRLVKVSFFERFYFFERNLAAKPGSRKPKRVWVWGSGFRVWVWGSWVWVQGLGLRVWGYRYPCNVDVRLAGKGKRGSEPVGQRTAPGPPLRSHRPIAPR